MSKAMSMGGMLTGLALPMLPGIGNNPLTHLASNHLLGLGAPFAGATKGFKMIKAPKMQQNDFMRMNNIGSKLTKIGNFNMLKLTPTDLNYVDSLIAGLGHMDGQTHIKTAAKKDMANRNKAENAVGMLAMHEKIASKGLSAAPRLSALISELMGETAKTPQKTLLGGGASALQLLGLGTIGALGVGTAVGKTKDFMKSQVAYSQMFEEFPELAVQPRKEVDKYWKVLSDFSPKLTTNPLVAGQFISNMIDYGMKGVDHNVISQLVGIDKDIQSSSSGKDLYKGMFGLGNIAYKYDLENTL